METGAAMGPPPQAGSGDAINPLDKRSMDLSSAIRISVKRISRTVFAGLDFSVYSLASSLSLAVCALAYRQKMRRGARIYGSSSARFFPRSSICVSPFTQI
ncbi:hypothetical protein [Methylocystis sp. S23]